MTEDPHLTNLRQKRKLTTYFNKLYLQNEIVSENLDVKKFIRNPALRCNALDDETGKRFKVGTSKQEMTSNSYSSFFVNKEFASVLF